VGDGAMRRGGGARAEIAAVYCDEARTKTFQARVILVAARLIDYAFTPEFRLQRLHRDTIRLHRAVPAPLAHEFVDEHALRRIGQQPALAAATLLGRAGLVVDQDGETGGLAQGALHLIENRRGGESLLPWKTPRRRNLLGSSLMTTMRFAPSAAI